MNLQFVLNKVYTEVGSATNWNKFNTENTR